jgi:hypothetical protein
MTAGMTLVLYHAQAGGRFRQTVWMQGGKLDWSAPERRARLAGQPGAEERSGTAVASLYLVAAVGSGRHGLRIFADRWQATVIT